MVAVSEPTLSRKALAVLLTLGLVISAIGVLYVALAPPQFSDPQTEFYILGTAGNASGYPTDLTTGETGTLLLGVTNQEHERTTYTAFMLAEDRVLDRHHFALPAGETWQQEVSFTLETAGQTRVRFLLFLGDVAEPTGEPYRQLYLIVEASTPT